MAYQFVREPLTSDETDSIIKAAQEPEEKLVIWTLLDTGLRVSELSSLTKDSIDFQLHRITIMGKGKKRRIVPVSARLREILESYLIVNDTFSMSVRKIQRIVLSVARRAKIRKRVTCHVLRHTFSVQALQRGVSLATLMKILGHSNLQTTAIYLNLAPEEAMKEFNEKW